MNNEFTREAVHSDSSGAGARPRVRRGGGDFFVDREIGGFDNVIGRSSTLVESVRMIVIIVMRNEARQPARHILLQLPATTHNRLPLAPSVGNEENDVWETWRFRRESNEKEIRLKTNFLFLAAGLPHCFCDRSYAAHFDTKGKTLEMGT